MNDAQSIDPALGLMKEFSRVSSGTSAAIQGMRQRAIFTDGVVPARFKALAAVVWSVSARCEPCIRYYVGRAKELGVTREELGEVLGVASTMGGCVGEMWALKAYRAYVEDGAAGEDACCPA